MAYDNTDTIMFDVQEHLFHDMHRSLGLVGRTKLGSASMSRDIVQIRENSLTLHESLTPTQYKWFAQVNGFLKRYTFQKDLYTPFQRAQLTDEKFLRLQETLALNYMKPRKLRTHIVICKTRQIVKRILQGFEPSGCDPRGQFGTKATVGCPKSSGYVDTKLTEKSITGSAGHLEWFENELLASDQLLASIVAGASRTTSSSLAQVNVPKKFSIDRGINPNTLTGSYYTSSLGRILQEALRQEGLDITKLQHIHGILARKASEHGRWVTADLSDASHGFLSNLLNALLPRKWYRAVMRGVIRQVEVAGRVSRLESIMTMGIGFTFPMQTLLFYCLLKALSELSGVNGLISVYGDDLIYPKKLHHFVSATFKDLGFKLNLDKTFVNSRFRESCGSDFFGGKSVRPFAPEGHSETLGRVKYAAFCYKILNGLLRRWSADEIRFTVDLLCREIVRVMGSLYIVPSEHPDHSGLKLATSCYFNDFLWYAEFPVSPWLWHPGKFAYVFPFIQSTPGRRYVRNMEPYYWDTLRAMSTSTKLPESTPLKRSKKFLALSWLSQQEFSEPLFKWRKNPGKAVYIQDLQGKRRRRKVATVSSKDEHMARYEVILAEVQMRTEEEYST